MKIVFKLILVVLLVGMILGAIMYTTEMPNSKNNGFYRIWNDVGDLPQIAELKLEEALNGIVGVSDESLFISGESFRGTLIIQKDFQSKDTLLINLNLEPDKMVPYRMEIDSPKLFLHLNNLPGILFGKFPNDTLILKELKGGLFTKSVQISDSTLLIRTLDNTMRNQTFKRVNVSTGVVDKEFNFIAEKDNSVGMSSEGMMVYDKETSNVLYIELFRNRIYMVDTNLNVISRGKTIDTFGVNSITISVGKMEDSTIRLESNNARIQVNNYCFINNDKLYVLSGVRSDDQNVSDFNKHLVFDIYDSKNLTYKGSRKIRKPENGRFKSATAFNDTITVLYDKQLVMYKLDN